METSEASVVLQVGVGHSAYITTLEKFITETVTTLKQANYRASNLSKSKIWILPIWHYPIQIPPPPHTPPPDKHNAIQSLNGLGHYIKSYVRYRPSQFTFMIVLWWWNNLCQWWNTCKNAPETELWIKENSNFGRKWHKFQIKAQKSS